MLLYSHHITPRLQYIIDYFNEKLGLNTVVTDDENLYKAHRSEKINYSATRISDDELFIQPVGLLAQAEIKKQKIECFEWNGTAAFFKTEDDIGFDIFSAVFYCLSRYEEYLEHEPDEYGRYAHWNSLAWKNNFLMKPVVDVWLQKFGMLLQSKFPASTTSLPVGKVRYSPFTFIPTYDIDIAWTYKNKGFWRNLGATVKQPSSIVQRLRILSGKEQDPFDSFDWLRQIHQPHQPSALYFFLVAKERSELDKNISPRKKALQQLIAATDKHATVGLHHSVYSNTAKENLFTEKKQLEQILKKPVTSSRHHYLRLHIPHSYRELMKVGITDDYSMGYGTVNGFRASTSNSFLWYDLEQETTTSLRIHPFAFMEATSFYEQHHTPQEAATELQQLVQEIQKVQGTCITVFHNQFLGSDPLFTGWKEMYSSFTASLQ
jgi:hypothetical protein